MIHDQAISIYRLHFFLAFLEVRLAGRGKVTTPGIQSTVLIIFSLGSRMINMLAGVFLCRQRTTRARRRRE